jgi:adenosine kinase
MKEILVLGSIAYDYIMDFDGYLNDNLTSDKQKKIFNIAVMPTTKNVRFGGTSGNISYNLAQIGAPVQSITSVGHDFISLGYNTHLSTLKSLRFNGIIEENLFTASCYIVNDKNHNQMIIFHQGAMAKSAEIDLKKQGISSESVSIASVSPDNYPAMIKWAKQLKELGIRFILDPGQVTPAFSSEILKELIPSASILIGNEYEIKMIQEKLNTNLEGLLELIPRLIITLGEKGSVCYDAGNKYEIKCCRADEILDTTGAGDGYRAGLLYGLANNLKLREACEIGAVTSSFVVETVGPQTQKYTFEKIKRRFQENFQKELKID